MDDEKEDTEQQIGYNRYPVACRKQKMKRKMKRGGTLRMHTAWLSILVSFQSFD